MTDPRPAGPGVRPFPGEPVARWWVLGSWPALADELVARGPSAEAGDPRPVIVAVDDRQGSGKTIAGGESR